MSAPKGFTLIEAIIYVALLGVLLVGVITSAYPLLTGAERITAKITAEHEAVFILRKISWALSSASNVSSPAAGGSGSSLTVGRVGGGTVTLAYNGSTITESINGTAALPLTAARVSIKNFAVRHVAPSGGTQRYVEVEFDAGDDHIGPLRKYLHF
jgi:hypothetical protein